MSKVRLREVVDFKLAALDRLIHARAAAIERATLLAAATLDKRLEGMNEFRDALKDQTALFVTKVDVASRFGALEQRLQSLEMSRAYLLGAAALGGGVTGLLTAVLAGNIR